MTGWWGHDPRLDVILDLLADALTQGRTIMATLSDISLAIQRQTTVEQSVVALLRQLSAQLHDAVAAEDPVAVQAVVDLIDQNTKVLSDAVFANTPLALGTATPGIPELDPPHVTDTTANTQPPDAQPSDAAPSDAQPPDAVPVEPDAPPPNGKKRG
jgi:hypothetical protein